jgi:hypothetical protein
MSVGLRLGYLVGNCGIAAFAVWPSNREFASDVPRKHAHTDAQHHLNAYRSLRFESTMEVLRSDGKHVGTVDHKEGDDLILLTKNR